jgi:thioredoxin 1
MTPIREISADSFDREVTQTDHPVVVQFWIRSCSHCQRFNPVYEQLPPIFKNHVAFVKLNMLHSIDNLHLAEGLGVEDTPTLKIFCQGSVVGELVGYRPLNTVVGELKTILEHEACSPGPR